MKKKPLPLSEVYRLLEPGPVVLVSSHYKGHDNVMSMSWHTMMEFEPPLVGCVISNRDYSFNMIKSSKECVLNIPTITLAKEVVGCGNTSGRRLDKFKKFHLTPTPAAKVRAPLIDECYASLECKVVDTRMVEKYNFFILEVVHAWVDPKEKNPTTLHHRGAGVFMMAGPSRKLRSKAK